MNYRQINHIRRTLHNAESQIYFDKPTHHDIDKSLSVLAKGLPTAVWHCAFRRHHIEKFNNFWVTVDKNRYVQGLVTSDALLAVFRQVVRYANQQALKIDGRGTITIQHPEED